MILRQRPETVDDVIETRIAVVGNGKLPFTNQALQADSSS